MRRIHVHTFQGGLHGGMVLYIAFFFAALHFWLLGGHTLLVWILRIFLQMRPLICWTNEGPDHGKTCLYGRALKKVIKQYGSPVEQGFVRN